MAHLRNTKETKGHYSTVSCVLILVEYSGSTAACTSVTMFPLRLPNPARHKSGVQVKEKQTACLRTSLQ